VPKFLITFNFVGKLFHNWLALNLTHLTPREELALDKWRSLVDLVWWVWISLLGVKKFVKIIANSLQLKYLIFIWKQDIRVKSCAIWVLGEYCNFGIVVQQVYKVVYFVLYVKSYYLVHTICWAGHDEYTSIPYKSWLCTNAKYNSLNT